MGQFDNGTSFGRFDCSFKDICSHVERLVMDGYIKRDQTHPQMLKYVPDPSENTKEKEKVL